MNIDFSKIDKEKTESLMLYIKPQGPLHMSVKLGGKYNNTILKPTENMIYGLLENVLGLHLDLDTRKLIKDFNKSKNKKQTSSNRKSFMPIINDYVDIENVELLSSKNEIFDDFSKYFYDRKDKSHFTGVDNFDISFAYKERKEYDKSVLDKFPEFYSGIIKKQYVIIDGHYIISLKLNSFFKKLIEENICDVSTAYLGSSESIVNVYLNNKNLI